MRFGQRGKLVPRYIGPFEILKTVGDVAYRIALPPNQAKVHPVLHVSMLWKSVHDPSHMISYDDFCVESDVTYEVRPVQILAFKEKVLRRKIVKLVKVLWHSGSSEEMTWELGSKMRAKHPKLFPLSSALLSVPFFRYFPFLSRFDSYFVSFRGRNVLRGESIMKRIFRILSIFVCVL